MRRVILHADMDAFFAAIEQRDRPELRGKPVMVGGPGDRGVVTAASYEARVYGVHSAMPTVEARRLCPHGVFLRGDMSRYSRESKKIFEIFGRFTPVVQGRSLDEAFLDISGMERLFGPPAQLGERLRAEVRAERNLAVSIGIAPVKMVAKIASDSAKPDGLLEVPEDRMRAFLEPLSVGRIWGVGPVAQAKLRAAGFDRIGDLARADASAVAGALGTWGLEVARLARAEEFSEVEPYREPVSYSEENTFAEDVSDPAFLRRTILAHAETVARRLRADGWKARTVILKLKLARRRTRGPRGYPLLTRRTTLADATDDGQLITRAGYELLSRSELREPVRLLGVGVTNLVPETGDQLTLFPPLESVARRSRLNRALDEISKRFGQRKLVRGGTVEAEQTGLSRSRPR